jgi:hypothetical protein
MGSALNWLKLASGKRFAPQTEAEAVLDGMILCELIGLLIHTRYFPDNLFLDVYSLIFPSFLLPYMLRSERVSLVFLTKDWAEAAFLWPKVKEAMKS